MIKTIAILGCGWLGFPLAKALLEAGYVVYGSTTSEEKLGQLSQAGIKAFRILLGETGIAGPMEDFLEGAQLLVINVPPGLRGGGGEDYVRKMAAVHKALTSSTVSRVLFVSSTSVYGDSAGTVTEATLPAPVTASGRQVLEAEKCFRDDPDLQTIVVRFGGLIGPGRHPVTHLAGKKGLRNGNAPVNLIHLDDCIHLVKTVIEGGHWGQVFNGVFPAHPAKCEYYPREALKRNLPPPHYEPSRGPSNSKIVISKNFLTNNYSFFTSISS